MEIGEVLRDYCWMIDDLTDEISFWIEHGFDKEQPVTFEKMKINLERAKTLQNRTRSS